MPQWRHLPVPAYYYVNLVCVVRLSAWIFKDMGSMEMLQLLLLLL